MTTSISGSAKIYAFPPRGRFALRVQGDEAPVTHVQLPYGVKLVSGNGWYHDEAIESATKSEQDHKN
jgi:Protein of unknown function (DUF2735)